MNKKRIRTIVIVAVAVLLLGTMLLHLEIELPGSEVPKASGNYVALERTPQPSAEQTPQPEEPSMEKTPEPSAAARPQPTEEQKSEPTAETENSEPQPDEADDSLQSTYPPVATEPPAAEETPAPGETVHTCTVEVRCDTVVDTSKLENEAVIPYIPADGVILPVTVVEFIPGETAFDVLKRATRANDVQLEFRGDPVYSGGINIEGIGYLYDFDAGALSGWMYKVNEQFPNHGTNSYYVEDDDVLVWVYTCDLGVDVGDNSVWW